MNYQQTVEKNYRWNFFWLTLDNMMFFFIFMGLSPYTILPFYLKNFTASPILIAMIPAIYIVGQALPQPFMAKFLKGKPERKKYLLLAAYFQRFGILGLFMLTVIQPLVNLPPTLTIVLFFLALTIQVGGSGFYLPTWLDFVGRAIPRRRGLLFGVSNFFGGIMGIGIGWLLSYLLGHYPYHQAMPVITGIAFLASMLSFGAILAWREAVPPMEELNPKVEQGKPGRIRDDKNFIKYLVLRGITVVLEIAVPLYTLYALDIIKVPAAQIGVFTLILSLSETVFNPLWGWIGDKSNYKYVILAAGGAGALAALFAAGIPTLAVSYLVFLLAGMMVSGFQLANFQIIFDFSPRHMVPSYTAISQIALSPVTGVAPFIGGYLIQTLGYASTFWGVGIIGLASLAGMAIFVRDPKEKKPLVLKPVKGS